MQQCVQKCDETDYIKNQRYCINQNDCKFHKNEICLDTCDYFYFLDTSLNTVSYNCSEACPSELSKITGSQCVEKCVYPNKYSKNNYCVDSCPTSMYIYENDECKTEPCETQNMTTLVINGSNLCINNCSDYFKSLEEDKCVATCD